MLLDSAGVMVDEVVYPSQRPNISYSRFKDGLQTFVYNPFPSPGRPNLFNGQADPLLKFDGVVPATFQPSMTNVFLAEVPPDVNVPFLTMVYQRLDQPNASVQEGILYDDGLHGDGAAGDGRFAGQLEGILPPAAELQFFFKGRDLNDEAFESPEEPEFGEPGELGNAFQLAFRTAGAPTLELSEIVALNRNSLIDESNATPDWVEIRNYGLLPVSLDGVSLSQQIGDNARYNFPPATALPPGGTFIVYCDGEPARGSRHAPFRLSNDGELLMLTGLTTNYSRVILDWVVYPSLGPDEAYARMGAQGNWLKTTPTPGTGNVAAAWRAYREPTTTGEVFALVFPTTTNAIYTVQFAPSLEPGTTWTNLPTVLGNGVEQLVRRPMATRGFFRVRRDPLP